MPENYYRVTISGRMVDGRPVDQAALVLAKAFHVPQDKAVSLFNGSPTTFYKDLNKELAEKICLFLRKAGAECEMKPVVESLALEVLDEEMPKAAVAAPQVYPAPFGDVQQGRAVGQANEVASKVNVTQKVKKRAPPAEASVVDDPVHWPAKSDLPVAESPLPSVPQSIESQVLAVVTEEPTRQKINLPTKPILMGMAGVLLLALLASVYIFMGFGSAPDPLAQPTRSTVAVSVPEAAVANSSTQDQQFQQNEISLAKQKMRALIQSVKIWMLQFGGGSDPREATLQRLQKDIGVSNDDLQDPWGTEIRYLPDAGRFSVISAGPDQQFDTADDIRLEHRM